MAPIRFEPPKHVGVPPGVDLSSVDADLKEVLERAEWQFTINGLLSAVVTYTFVRFFRFLKGTNQIEDDHPGDLEAVVTETPQGVVCNFPDDAQSRRDPAATEVADDEPTCKPRFNPEKFREIRRQGLEWFSSLADDGELLAVAYKVGRGKLEGQSVLLCPKSCAIFAFWLSLLQRIMGQSGLSEGFAVRHILCLAPPFRHSWFEGRQKVIHRRNQQRQFAETWAFSLYPGPSGKKGIYGILLWIARFKDDCMTVLHGAGNRIRTKFNKLVVWIHQGPSGSGKSETNLPSQCRIDGRLLVATNSVTGEEIVIDFEDPPAGDIHFLADDMVVASIEDGYLVLCDGEDGWFIRIDGCTRPGADPFTEFLWRLKGAHRAMLSMIPSLDMQPWDHLPLLGRKKRNSNPRFIVERRHAPTHIAHPVQVGPDACDGVFSFGLRCPEPNHGEDTWAILGMVQIVPVWLFWAWQLISIRASKNPSIHKRGPHKPIEFEGPGAYQDFLLGDLTEEANRQLRLYARMPENMTYLLIPNQWIGIYELGGHGFAPQNIVRRMLWEGNKPQAGEPARCALLGHCAKEIVIDGYSVPKQLLQPWLQEAFGTEAYDKGAAALRAAFEEGLRRFLDSDELLPEAREIIEALLSGRDLSGFNPDLSALR